MSDAALGYQSDHRVSLMRLAAESPQLAPLCIEVAHQHDCLEDVKTKMHELPAEMRAVVRAELTSVAREREQSWGAWWRSLRGWVTTGAAVLAGLASLYSAMFHR